MEEQKGTHAHVRSDPLVSVPGYVTSQRVDDATGPVPPSPLWVHVTSEGGGWSCMHVLPHLSAPPFPLAGWWPSLPVYGCLRAAEAVDGDFCFRPNLFFLFPFPFPSPPPPLSISVHGLVNQCCCCWPCMYVVYVVYEPMNHTVHSEAAS